MADNREAQLELCYVERYVSRLSSPFLRPVMAKQTARERVSSG